MTLALPTKTIFYRLAICFHCKVKFDVHQQTKVLVAEKKNKEVWFCNGFEHFDELLEDKFF